MLMIVLYVRMKAGTCLLLFVLVTCSSSKWLLVVQVTLEISSLNQISPCVQTRSSPSTVKTVANLWRAGCVASSCPDLTSSHYTNVSVPLFRMCEVRRRNQLSESTAIDYFIGVCDAQDKDWQYYLHQRCSPHIQSQMHQRHTNYNMRSKILADAWGAFFPVCLPLFSLGVKQCCVKGSQSLHSFPPPTHPTLRNDGDN